MARRKSRYRRHRRLPWLAAVALAVPLMWYGLFMLQQNYNLPLNVPAYSDLQAKIGELYGYSQGGLPSPVPLLPKHEEVSAAPGGFELYMLDVGQGLSVLARAPTGETVLIDGGDRNAAKTILDFLRDSGIEKLDYLICTHGHADHIGGLVDVAKGRELGTVIMGNLPEDVIPTTKSYTDLLSTLAQQQNTVVAARPGDTYQLGEAVIELLGPIKEYDDLNDLSIISRITYGDVSFMITGDASQQAEEDMLSSSGNVRSNVLIAGHHGSADASSEDFLRAVFPQYVGISCAAGNSYGHPHEAALSRIGAIDAKILRTDLHGAVRFYTDGKALEVSGSK